MLIGEYKHTLDEKNRLSLPSKFRKVLGKKVVVTKGLDRCLFVYSEKAWGKIAEKYGDLSIAQIDTRRFNRFMLSGAAEADIDSAGRIVVPDFLKSFAGLGQKVILAGLYDRVEIWDQDSWNDDKSKIEGQADALAEKLGDLGVL